MQAAGIGSAHISGLSLGAATGMGLAAKHPPLVKSLSLHSAWHSTDPFLRAVVETRFADPLSAAIPDTELVIFEDCAHAPIYENVDGFNRRSLAFLQRHTG